MSDLIVACLRIGVRCCFDRVTTMRNQIARHLDRKHTLVCLTDQPERCSGVAFVDISAIGLVGWWNKMVLFEPMWRGRSKVIFLELDVSAIGDLSPLADVPGEFSVISQKDVAARYDTRVMVIGGGMGNFIWSAFDRRRDLLMMDHRRSGPPTCIEELYPSAQSLQAVLPPGFFSNRLQIFPRF
jgi:hypothetical protein